MVHIIEERVTNIIEEMVHIIEERVSVTSWRKGNSSMMFERTWKPKKPLLKKLGQYLGGKGFV